MDRERRLLATYVGGIIAHRVPRGQGILCHLERRRERRWCCKRPALLSGQVKPVAMEVGQFVHPFEQQMPFRPSPPLLHCVQSARLNRSSGADSRGAAAPGRLGGKARGRGMRRALRVRGRGREERGVGGPLQSGGAECQCRMPIRQCKLVDEQRKRCRTRELGWPWQERSELKKLPKFWLSAPFMIT